MTALTTAFFLTSLPGITVLTLQTMTSPRPAVRRLLPPSTLKHMTSFAPVLSATVSRVCIWIMGLSRSGIREDSDLRSNESHSEFSRIQLQRRSSLFQFQVGFGLRFSHPGGGPHAGDVDR